MLLSSRKVVMIVINLFLYMVSVVYIFTFKFRVTHLEALLHEINYFKITLYKTNDVYSNDRFNSFVVPLCQSILGINKENN